MKKILILLLALSLIFSLCACGAKTEDAPAPTPEPAEATPSAEDDTLKIGLVCAGDEDATYDSAHISALRAAAETVGIPTSDLLFKYNVPADEQCYDAIADLIDSGCDIVFTDDYSHQEFAHMAAVDNPDVIIVSIAGDYAGSAGLDNFKNAFCRAYESSYVAGVVAGMKLQSMVSGEELTEENYDENGSIRLGYVAGTPSAEITSSYTAFYLGVKSVVENVVMDVIFASDLYDPSAESAAADALINEGCCIIGQHTASTAVSGTVQAARDSGSNVYCVGCGDSMLNVAPLASLTSAAVDWSVFYTYALQCMVDGTAIDTDWAEGYSAGACFITELGASCAAGTAEKVAEVESALADGSLNVFDCSTFTVDGETVTTFTALDTDGDLVPDAEEAIVDGVFQESSLRSAPYFTLDIDGITVITS